MRRRSILVLALLVCAQVGGAAQVRVVRHGDDRLVGIHAVDVLVEAPTPDDVACAVTPAHLRDTARTILTAAGLTATISLKASSSFHTVTIDRGTLLVEGHCVSSLVTELITHVEGIPQGDRYAAADAWGSLLVGPMPMLRESALVSARPAQHTATVQAALTAQLTTMARRMVR